MVPRRELVAVSGERLSIPDGEQMIHLQLRRFAGCPVCNLHLKSVVRRRGSVEAAGIREVIVFHSSVEELLVHAADFPFPVVADPEKRLYAEFGAEAAPRAMLNPRAWVPITRGVLLSLWAIIRKRGRAPAINPQGGRYGLPAEFLIAQDGRVLACKYGAHVYDQWSVVELLALARRHPVEVGQASSSSPCGTISTAGQSL